MAEPISTTAFIAGTLAVGRKVLGPTIDQFATDLKEIYSAWRAANFEKILRKAARRSSSEAPGSVHPRVAKTVLDEGSWVDDSVTQEYLAGLLVASRTADGSDDSGAYYAQIAARLTAAQVRLHFLVYSALEGTLDLTQESPLMMASSGTDQFNVATTFNGFYQVFGTDEGKDGSTAFGDAALGLKREGLIEGFSAHPPSENAPGGYVVFVPSMMGMALYTRVRVSEPDAHVEQARVIGAELEPFENEPARLPSPIISEYTVPAELLIQQD